MCQLFWHMSIFSMNKLYFWGANSHGQSGTGNISEQFVNPTLVPFGEEIQQITGGGAHSFILTKNAEIYGCGWNNLGQIGITSETENVTNFEKLPFSCDKIFAGWDVSAGILESQGLVWGNNRYEQFGTSGMKNQNYLPQKLLDSEEEILDIAFGLRHTVVLIKNKVQIFGKSKCLKLIKESASNSKTFTSKSGVEIIELPIENALKISSGQHHFLIQINSKEIICLGDNKFGQCADYTKIKHDKEIFQIFTGWTHSGFLDSQGRIFMWGRNNYFQLGQATNEPFSRIPLKVDVPGEVIEVQSGSEHVVARTTEGIVYSWGWNEHGNCGNGGTENVPAPVMVKLKGKCIKLGTGAGFTFAVVEEK